VTMGSKRRVLIEQTQRRHPINTVTSVLMKYCISAELYLRNFYPS